MLAASYYDGRSTRVQEVALSIADHHLVVAGEGLSLRVPFEEIRVDERLGTAPRRLRFADGTFCEVRDQDRLDELLDCAGHRDHWVDRMAGQWRAVLACCVAFVAVVGAVYRWGLPLAAEIGARHLPPAISKVLTRQTLQVLDGRLLQKSTLSPQIRARLTARFRALRLPQGLHSSPALLFRSAPQLGANAFTLPDGAIVLLDDLVQLLDDDDQVVAALSHELGHAYGHHGLQLLLQSSVIGAFWTLYVGDVSALLAAAPATLVQARYSQQLEQQADDFGAAVLLDNGLSPELMASALRKLLNAQPDRSSGGYLSSHPSTAARLDHLHKLAAAARKTK